MNPLKEICDIFTFEIHMEISIVVSIKLPSVSISKINTYRAITWPIVMQVHNAIWRHYASNEFSIYLTFILHLIDIKLVNGLVISVLWLSAGMALDKLIMNNFPSLNGKIEIHDSQCNLRCQAINMFLNILQN